MTWPPGWAPGRGADPAPGRDPGSAVGGERRLIGTLGGLLVGDGHPVRVMAVLNVSLDSFYSGSVATDLDDLARRAEAAEREGADFVDIGAMSTRPLRDTAIPAAQEAGRLAAAVARVRSASSLPISADTQRATPAIAAIAAGACIVNDVSGLRDDPELARVVASRGIDLILMARALPAGRGEPIARVARRLRGALDRATGAGVPLARVVVDPGIGFTTQAELSSTDWNLRLLRDLARLRRLGRPILVGVSRKGFVGRILDQPDPADRLIGSLAATAVAVYNGAHVIRTHDVAATHQAVRMAAAIRTGQVALAE